ncbi:Reticuline oxidase [Capsicum baccatum]|uniref:Reticuline oxidase n=1 Tax=Capsicum baccatum TaxID=33114 RepID=A0A2G2WKA5_CAPBA|nr:Reticuline oxidase [Capsicum baccatum]
MLIRVRGGGHNYEGLSYVSEVPFVMVDLIKLRTISVNVSEKSAWIGAGSTNGELLGSICVLNGKWRNQMEEKN